MHESLSSYLKLIPFAIKKKRVREFINLKYQKDTDHFRKKRLQDYIKREVDIEKALLTLFPLTKIQYDIFDSLEDHLDLFIKKQQNKKYPTFENPYPINYGLDRNVSRLLYFISKYSKPDLIIETGIANGFSSSYLLLALEHNKYGNLISIDDIVRPWHIPESMGLAIPNNLKKRHQIVIGNASTKLSDILREKKYVDIFIHDSSHTYQNMQKEFRIAWPYVKNGGFLLSDDVSQHDAFIEFADEVKMEPLIIKKENGSHFGIIKK